MGLGLVDLYEHQGHARALTAAEMYAQPWPALGHRLCLTLGLCWKPSLVQQWEVAVTLIEEYYGLEAFCWLFVVTVNMHVTCCSHDVCCGGHGEKSKQWLICSPWFSISHSSVAAWSMWKMQHS